MVISASGEELKDPKVVEVFQAAMDAEAEYFNSQIEELMNTLNCSFACAADVVYLRTRSRWSEELERRLIQEHQEGRTINICDWPNDLGVEHKVLI